MFERYSERARRVIFFARYEASNYGSRIIEPEHILLGLLREPSKSMQVYFGAPHSLEALRKEIEGGFIIGPRFETSVEVPLSDKSKHVLIVAAKEANRLSHKIIETEHILFAILQEDCAASRILIAHGMKRFEPQEELHKVDVYDALPPTEPTWQERGIPEGYGFSQLLFNPPTGTIVVELCRGGTKSFAPTRLFWRRQEADKYEPLGQPEESCSQESAVTSLVKPILFFSSMRFAQREESHASGEWDSLYSVDLRTLTTVRYASKETLQLPAPYNDCWVTSLLSISDDGALLYLTVGMCQMNGANRSNVAYYLSELDVTTKHLRTISPLRATLF